MVRSPRLGWTAEEDGWCGMGYAKTSLLLWERGMQRQAYSSGKVGLEDCVYGIVEGLLQ